MTPTPDISPPATVASHLSAGELFALAERSRSANHPRDAFAIWDTLARDPDPEVRAEARFRKGMALAAEKRWREAAVVFRALLDEKPGATRVRLELARVLNELGDEAAARREIRQARAGSLPADVAVVVDRFAEGLRSRRRFGGSAELAFAPSSNVNRATDQHTLDTVIAPLTLSRDARQRSGLGLHVAGDGYARLLVGDSVAVVAHTAVQGDLYGARRFDDISGSALIGLEWQIGRDRISPSAGAALRWYGGPLYAQTETVALDWLHPAGPRGQLDVQASAARAQYCRIDLQDGGLYAVRASYDRALGSRGGATLTIDTTRQDARDPGYATWSGGLSVLGWQTMGRTTGFATVGFHRLVGDERLFLFPRRRIESLWQVSGGATFRRFTVAGFAPLIRISFEDNLSTVGLYAYRRVTAQFGITRAF